VNRKELIQLTTRAYAFTIVFKRALDTAVDDTKFKDRLKEIKERRKTNE
jgi:hypothetical protein